MTKVYGERSNAMRRMKQLVALHPEGVFELSETSEGFTIAGGNEQALAALAQEATKPVRVRAPKAPKPDAPEAPVAETTNEEMTVTTTNKRKAAPKKAAPKKVAKKAAPKKARAASNGEYDRSLAAAVAKCAARIKAGEPPFRAGTKRDELRKMLEKGTTIESAMEKLNFARVTVHSGFFSTARLMGRTIARNEKTGKYAFVD